MNGCRFRLNEAMMHDEPTTLRGRHALHRLYREWAEPQRGADGMNFGDCRERQWAAAHAERSAVQK